MLDQLQTHQMNFGSKKKIVEIDLFQQTCSRQTRKETNRSNHTTLLVRASSSEQGRIYRANEPNLLQQKNVSKVRCNQIIFLCLFRIFFTTEVIFKTRTKQSKTITFMLRHRSLSLSQGFGFTTQSCCCKCVSKFCRLTKQREIAIFVLSVRNQAKQIALASF